MLSRYNTTLRRGPRLFRSAEPEKGWGSSKFCSVARILQCEELKERDVLHLHYTIHEFPQGYGSWPLNIRPPLRSLSNAMATLFDGIDTADVCFVVRHAKASDDCPKRIYAHTKILSSRCDYFRTLFQSGFSENDESFGDPESFNEDQWEQGSDSDYEDYTEEGIEMQVESNGQPNEDGLQQVEDIFENREADDISEKQEQKRGSGEHEMDSDSLDTEQMVSLNPVSDRAVTIVQHDVPGGQNLTS
ncbi:hypothetical protein NEOLEDRAFT_741543 [Neolentinus lepideus HHB14362 ss-1]|uniref:BTB domain-containing protein n=1 Tax=Neolentinus lepideus HHB14362 ss-1 TaxID=1314782 RepID=A0A165PVS6_9AGAM|nr:hypothetical protein NEOLEDRAFT_741543 [Neolentinus lepideus HHB14362 ss-1]